MPKVGFRHTEASKQKMSSVKRSRQPTVENRFWAKVNKDGPVHKTYGRCWVWTASTFVSGIGYGQFTGRPAHRVSWGLHNGDIPDRLLVLHKCDNLGEDCSWSKLTEEDVKKIRKLHKRGAFGYKRLAKMFNVAPMTIARVVRRECWKHI